MIRDLATLRERPAALALAAALALLPAFPPDVLGDACAGLAGLVALAALAGLRDVSGLRGGFFAAAAALAIPTARVAQAPGAAVWPLAAILVCAAAALVAAGLPDALRSLGFWSGLIAAAGAWAGLRSLWEISFGLDAMRVAAEAATALPDRALVLARIAEGRAYAGFPTPAALGGFLALALGVTAGAAMDRSGRSRAALVAAAALQAVGLVASRSLSAAGALVVAVALYGLRARAPGISWRRLGAALAVAVVLLVAVVALRGRAVLDAGAANSPWALRLGNVRAAVAMSAEHPWLGVGPGGYGEAFPRYQAPGGNTSRHAHSLPFDLVSEWGLPLGALLTLSFFAVFLGPLTRAPGGATASGMAVGLAAFGLQNLADFTALLPTTLGAAAIVRGLAARRDATGARDAAPLGRAGFAVAALAACVVFALDGLAADSRREAREAVAAAAGEAALRAVDRSIALAPWDPGGHLFRAEILESSGSPEALDEIEKALTLVPERPAAYAVRARLRARSGDLGGALADLGRAAQLYPANAEYAKARDDLARQVAGARP